MAALPSGNDIMGYQQTHAPSTWKNGTDAQGNAAAGNPWENYFGPIAGDIKTNPYDKFGYDNFTLPDAYNGRNMFLRDTIDGFIMEENAWYTTVCLPYVRTDEHHFSWNEWRFDTHLVGRVPEEGVSRMIRSSKRSFKESTVRRGIAFQLEHGFMNTPEGQQQYVMNLKQIKQSVQETANHDVVAALLSCRRYDREWEKRNGSYQVSPARLHRAEVSQWAIAQKHPNGLDILHEEFKERLNRWNVTPNMWIFPPKLCLFLTMVPPEKTEFMRVGSKGPATFDAGPKALTSFRGVNVFETRTFDVNEGDLPIDLLRRNQTIGEYNVMDDPHKNQGIASYKKYRSSTRDIIVYNEDDDQWARMSFIQALQACKRPQGEGDYTGVNDDVFFYNDNGVPTPCTYFGQMQPDHLTNDSVLKVATTMAASIPDGGTPDSHFRTINSLIHQYNYNGVSSIPMFKRNAATNTGVSVSTVADKMAAKGFDPNFVTDTVARLGDHTAAQQFLVGLDEYVASNDDKPTKNLYKAMSKKAPKAQADLATWIATTPFWKKDLDTSSLVSETEWVKTSETWDSKYANDPNWMPGDPNTGYTTPSKVAYTPTSAWADTPWMVASRGRAAQSSTSQRRGPMQRFGLDSDLDDVLGAGASAKMARIGALFSGNDDEQTKRVGVLKGMPGDQSGDWAEERWKYASGLGDEVLKRCAQIFLLSDATVENLGILAKHNCFVPVNVVLARPGMEYQMGSAVLMKGGAETGMTAVGHNDFQLGDDVASKMHYGHYTFKSKAFVQQPRNIIIAENIFAQGYVKGNGVGFHSDDAESNPSIHAILCSCEQKRYPSPLSMAGNWSGENGKSHIRGADYDVFRGRWRSHKDDDTDKITDPTSSFLLNDVNHKNIVCFQGHQFNYDVEKNTFTVVTRNTGHWGPNVYPGCGAVRDGGAVPFKEQSWSTDAR